MPQSQGGYEFAAAEIAERVDRYVSLSFEPMDDRARRFFQDIWAKMATVVVKFHEHSGDSQCPAWTAWQVSRWSKEQVEGREGYVAWNGDLMAGFINLRFPFQSSIEPVRPITYLEHLAAFPGCQDTRIWNRRMKRVGQALLAFAIYTSAQRGYGGVVGLHAADESAQSWYDALNRKYGGSLLHGPIKNVRGFYERSINSPYYETLPEGALALLEQYRHG